MRQLVEHPLLKTVGVVGLALGVFFGIESCIESKRQSAWQAADAEWERRDIQTDEEFQQRQEQMLDLLERMHEACGSEGP